MNIRALDLTFCVLALVGTLLVSASMNRNGPDCLFAPSNLVIRTDVDLKYKINLKKKGGGVGLLSII